MKQQEVAEAYKNAAIENAPPIKIVRMLYAGAIRYIDQALAQDPTDPKSAFNDRVYRADRIVTELRLALIHEYNPQVGSDLERLYLFVEGRLARAALDRGAQPLREAKRILGQLQSAWNDIETPRDPRS